MYLYEDNDIIFMRYLRFFLFPFSVIYMLITSFRNLFFSTGIFKEVTYEVPSLGIGNLVTGGTGKSVAVNYFIALFKKNNDVTVLSRGYGRVSKGFQLGSPTSTAKTLGDEPKMFLMRHPEIRVGVSKSRRKGMQRLLSESTSTGMPVYLWDDCFQHRWVKPKCMLLLTTYDRPFTKDYLLPVGNLRELSEGAERADAIVITKCPNSISKKEMNAFAERIQIKQHQKLFFSSIKYAEKIHNNEREISLSVLERISFILVTGIADPSLLVQFLNKMYLDFEHLKYGDHHIFSDKDVTKIKSKSNGRMVLTTEKDFVRLSKEFDSDLLFYLPIEMEILDGKTEELNSFVKDKMMVD